MSSVEAVRWIIGRRSNSRSEPVVPDDDELQRTTSPHRVLERGWIRGQRRRSPSRPNPGGAPCGGLTSGSAECCCRRPAGVRAVDRRRSRPGFVREAIECIRAVMDGESEISVMPLDERGVDDFRRAVYAATRDIPAGTTLAHGEVARAIGRPDGARDVGAAARPQPVPDHRPVPPRRRSERGTHRVRDFRHRAAWRRSAECSSSKAAAGLRAQESLFS